VDERKQDVVAGDDSSAEFYQEYLRLRAEIRNWQLEQGPSWVETRQASSSMAQISDSFPTLQLAALPEQAVLELWQRLNEVGNLAVPKDDLQSLWQKYRTENLAPVSALSSRLQLAISGVAELLRSQVVIESGVSGLLGEAALCPICGTEPKLAYLSLPAGKRKLHCLTCGYEWETKRVGCVLCGSENFSQQLYLHAVEFPGVEVVACSACNDYFKEFDLRQWTVEDFVWEDLRTLALDFAAEKWLGERTQKIGKCH